jgi:hypothetical protein
VKGERSWRRCSGGLLSIERNPAALISPAAHAVKSLLDFAMKRLAYTDVLQQVSFRKYNALRMVSYERNLKEFGRQDIIYSMGFFDYVKDDIIIRMLNACYSLLNPHGMLIAPFKDCGRYGTQEYHWFVDWDAFYQRTDEESRALFAEAGIPDSELTAVRDGSGVIIFYVVSKG